MPEQQLPPSDVADPVARKHRMILISITAVLVLIPLVLGTLRLVGWL